MSTNNKYDKGNKISSNGHKLTSDELNNKIKVLSDKMLLKGLECAKVSDVTGAIKYLSNSVMLNKSNYNAFNLLGLCYYQVGEISLAIEQWVISKKIQSENNDATRYLDKVRASKSKLSNYNDSVKKYNQALEHCSKGSVDISMVSLKKAISLNPSFVNARLVLALCYYKDNKKSSALKEVNKVLEIDGGNLLAKKYLKEFSDKAPVKEEVQLEKDTSIDFGPRPIRNGANLALNRFISVIFGIALGALIVYFVVVPAIKDSQSAELEKKTQTIEKLNKRLDESKKPIVKKDGNVEVKDDEVTIKKTELEQLKLKSTEVQKLLLATQSYFINPVDKKKAADTLMSVNVGSLPEDTKATFDVLATEILPTTAATFYRTGYNSYRRGRYDDAIRDLEISYSYYANNYVSEKALYYLGRSYHKKGEKDRAIEIFKKFVETYPTSSLADDAARFIK